MKWAPLTGSSSAAGAPCRRDWLPWEPSDWQLLTSDKKNVEAPLSHMASSFAHMLGGLSSEIPKIPIQNYSLPFKASCGYSRVLLETMICRVISDIMWYSSWQQEDQVQCCFFTRMHRLKYGFALIFRQSQRKCTSTKWTTQFLYYELRLVHVHSLNMSTYVIRYGSVANPGWSSQTLPFNSVTVDLCSTINNECAQGSLQKPKPPILVWEKISFNSRTPWIKPSPPD